MVDPVTQKSVSTSEMSTVETDLVVTSIGMLISPSCRDEIDFFVGFRSSPTVPYFDPALNHLRTVGGRVVSADGQLVPNTYASGWASIGAKGVLAKTMLDAYAVADTVLDDLTKQYPEISDALMTDAEPVIGTVYEDVPSEVADGIQTGKVTTYQDWKRIDDEEQKRGKDLGKERERMEWEDAYKFLRV
jgi:adrenodoxin-NADP+ reductase